MGFVLVFGFVEGLRFLVVEGYVEEFIRRRSVELVVGFREFS